MCCNCRNEKKVVSVRCKQCLLRPLNIAKSVKDGSPPESPQSISLEGLKELLKRLSKKEGFFQNELEWVEEFLSNNGKSELTEEDITSEWIRQFILEGGQHPAKKYPKLFSPELPHAGVTYQWTLGLDCKSGLLSHVQNVVPKLRIWLDVIFIDQLSSEVAMNLAKAQEVYSVLPLHLVFPQSVDKAVEVIYPKRAPKLLNPCPLLDRGWCIFELCLRAIAGKKSYILGSLESWAEKYDFCGNMKLSVDADRAAIERALSDIFGTEEIEGKWVAVRSAVNSKLVEQVAGSSIEEALREINIFLAAAVIENQQAPEVVEVLAAADVASQETTAPLPTVAPEVMEMLAAAQQEAVVAPQETKTTAPLPTVAPEVVEVLAAAKQEAVVAPQETKTTAPLPTVAKKDDPCVLC